LGELTAGSDCTALDLDAGGYPVLLFQKQQKRPPGYFTAAVGQQKTRSRDLMVLEQEDARLGRRMQSEAVHRFLNGQFPQARLSDRESLSRGFFVRF